MEMKNKTTKKFEKNSGTFRQGKKFVGSKYQKKGEEEVTYKLTPWTRVLPEKLTGPQLLKKFPAFYKPEGSLPRLQEPATCLYPEPD